MIQNRKIETLEKEKERLEGMCETYETRIEKAKVEFEETLKKYSEANKVNLKKIEEEKRKELDRMSKDCEATKSELSTSLQVIDGYRKELELVYADTGGDGSTNTTSNDKDREAEQALYISNSSIQTIDQKEYEIRMLFKEVDASNRREESLREKVDILSAEKVLQQQRRRGERRAEDSFDDLSSTIDEEMLKTESSKIVNSSPKVSPSEVENSNASPTRRFGLFGRNNDSNNSNNNNKKNSSGGDRVGSNIASSPLSRVCQGCERGTPYAANLSNNPPTPQNVGSSVTKRTNVLPSEMKEMQQKVQELIAKVDGATTPQGITNALRELEELQQKLSGIEFTTDSHPPLSSSTKDEMNSYASFDDVVQREHVTLSAAFDAKNRMENNNIFGQWMTPIRVLMSPRRRWWRQKDRRFHLPRNRRRKKRLWWSHGWENPRRVKLSLSQNALRAEPVSRNPESSFAYIV